MVPISLFLLKKDYTVFGRLSDEAKITQSVNTIFLMMIS